MASVTRVSASRLRTGWRNAPRSRKSSAAGQRIIDIDEAHDVRRIVLPDQQPRECVLPQLVQEGGPIRLDGDRLDPGHGDHDDAEPQSRDVHDAVEHLRLDVAEQPFLLGVPQDRPDVMDLAGHHHPAWAERARRPGGRKPARSAAAAARSPTTSGPDARRTGRAPGRASDTSAR